MNSALRPRYRESASVGFRTRPTAHRRVPLDTARSPVASGVDGAVSQARAGRVGVMAYTQPPAFTTRPTLSGSFGMVASTHWLASQSAMGVLERGGNAFDAAVAGALVLQVVEPHLNGPGGDLVALVTPESQTTRVLCGTGPAPAGATIEHYRGLGLDTVPGTGYLAAPVPGAFDAWLLLLREHGSLEFADVAAPALHYAETGWPVLPAIARTIRDARDLFRDHWPTSAEHWLDDGEAPAAGSTRTSPAWGASLRRLTDAAVGAAREDRIEAVRREWAEGFVAHAIEQAVVHAVRDASGADHAGVITASDLAGWRATFEEPVSRTFRGDRVLKAGPWSAGPALLQALALLEPYSDEQLDPSTPAGAHLVLEALKLALADRDAHYGDSADVDLAALLSDGYTAERRALIAEWSSAELRPGRLPGRETWQPAVPRREPGGDAPSGVGEPTIGRPGAGDTCHLDVVDRHGNSISATPSGGWLQSSPYLHELGFALGTRLQMTWLDERSPSALKPGRRPRTTLSPTVVERADGTRIALGTPGGDQQDQWQLPMLLRVLVGGWGLQEAIDAPTLHTTSPIASFWPRDRTPGGAVVERPLGTDVLAELVVRGHDVTVAPANSLGRLSAVQRDPDGRLHAAANARGMQGYAVGR
jgi:gamma-glutamyltranspeptidase / glutathione hydrolase